MTRDEMDEAQARHQPGASAGTGPMGPLVGIRVVELGGIGPAPFCGMLLADLGAEVVRVERVAEAGRASSHPVLHRNRRSLAVDIRDPDGARAVRRVISTADVVLEGFRPGVAERLGLGPAQCCADRPALVYGRVTGWGQDGPLAQQPGHDLNYIAVTGALHAIGSHTDPVVPLNVIGDFGGGGMLLAIGVVAAVLHARATGVGQVVDAAMTDGSAALLAMTYGLLGRGRWRDERSANLLDGGAPFYGVYRCADGRHVAVGAIEPQFYAALVQTLGVEDDPAFAVQLDETGWPTMRARLEEIFTGRSRDAWADVFRDRSACVSPVLSLAEAPDFPHNAQRRTYLRTTEGTVEPAPAPRFSATPLSDPRPACTVGADSVHVLSAAGMPADDIAALRARGVLA